MMRHFTCKILRKSVSNLDDCMEKADSKDNLPPLASQNVVFKETAGDLCEGSSHVGSQAFRRLVSHLAMTSQRPTEKTTSNPENLLVQRLLLVVQAVFKCTNNPNDSSR